MEHNLRFGLVLGRLAVLKVAQNKLKYTTFKVSFFMFHGHFFDIVVKVILNSIYFQGLNSSNMNSK